MVCPTGRVLPWLPVERAAPLSTVRGKILHVHRVEHRLRISTVEIAHREVLRADPDGPTAAVREREISGRFR
jgi:hypothetical protein